MWHVMRRICQNDQTYCHIQQPQPTSRQLRYEPGRHTSLTAQVHIVARLLHSNTAAAICIVLHSVTPLHQANAGKITIVAPAAVLLYCLLELFSNQFLSVQFTSESNIHIGYTHTHLLFLHFGVDIPWQPCCRAFEGIIVNVRTSFSETLVNLPWKSHTLSIHR